MKSMFDAQEASCLHGWLHLVNAQARTLGLPVYRLPFASPANASWSFEGKLIAWREVLGADAHGGLKLIACPQGFRSQGEIFNGSC